MSQKTSDCMISFIFNSRKDKLKSIVAESITLITWGWRGLDGVEDYYIILYGKWEIIIWKMEIIISCGKWEIIILYYMESGDYYIILYYSIWKVEIIIWKVVQSFLGVIEIFYISIAVKTKCVCKHQNSPKYL